MELFLYFFIFCKDTLHFENRGIIQGALINEFFFFSGYPGSCHDSRIFGESSLYRKTYYGAFPQVTIKVKTLKNKGYDLILFFIQLRPLILERADGTEIMTRGYFLGDAAYPISDYFQIPYAGNLFVSIFQYCDLNFFFNHKKNC